MADETVKAYVAGIIDGEGCIKIERVKNHLTIGVAVSMTDRRVPDLLRGRYGGPIVFVTKRAEGHKPVYMWRVQARKAEVLLREIRPYLVVKVDQADLALSLRDHLREIGALTRGPGYNPADPRHLAIVEFREAAKQRMHALNKRGTN